MLKVGTRNTFLSLRVGTIERIWKLKRDSPGKNFEAQIGDGKTEHPEKKLRSGRSYDFFKLKRGKQ
jgi:hypothetical protein